MKKGILWSALAGSFLLVSSSRGGLIEGVELEAGVEIGDFHYRESHFMREDGVQYGIYGALSVTDAHPWIFQFYGSYVGGDVTYDGGYYSYWSGYHDLTGDTSNFIVNLRGLAGYDLGNANLQVLLYSGLGYRYLENDLRDLETNRSLQGLGYLREQTYFYLPLGCELAFPVSSDGAWSLGLRGEFDWMFYGYNFSGGTKLDNQKGWGMRLTPFLRWDLDQNVAFKLEVFGEYWKIDDSDVNQGFMEPENASNYYGGRLGIIF